MTSKTIAILGAGLLGRLLALELVKLGHHIKVFDRQEQSIKESAAYVAASMLAPLAESVTTEANIVEMGYYSLNRWKKLIASLSHEVFFQQEGSLLVWHQQDHSSAKHFSIQLQQIGLQLPHLPKPVHVDQTQLSTLEPQLSQHFLEGIYLPEEGQLDNRELLDALLFETELLGVTYHWNISIDLASFSNAAFDDVIDCRGIGSKIDHPELRGVRGEVLRVYAPEVNLHRPTRLIHPKYPLYIAPKRNHVYVIGATEIESEDDSAISVRSTLELLSAAYTVHSGFAEARIIEANAQCRPSFKNNLPKIWRSSSKVLHINGLYRHGFLITPAIVDSVISLLTLNDPSLAKQFQIPLMDMTHENIC
jgi:glycine oxidase